MITTKYRSKLQAFWVAVFLCVIILGACSEPEVVEAANTGVIFVGESHMVIADGNIFTDSNAYASSPLPNKYYVESLAGYHKDSDLFMVHTGMSADMGFIDWLEPGAGAMQQVDTIISNRPDITSWTIYVQQGASVCQPGNEGSWDRYKDIYKSWAAKYGKVYVMETPPIDEWRWQTYWRAQPAALDFILEHSNKQVQKFNNWMDSNVCNGTDIVHVRCYSQYEGKDLYPCDTSVPEAIDANHYAPATYAEVLSQVIENTVGFKFNSMQEESGTDDSNGNGFYTEEFTDTVPEKTRILGIQ